MKLGDALHIIWQNSHTPVISDGLTYSCVDGHNIGMNDLRAIWEYLNQEIPLEGTIIDAVSGKRASYVSECKK